MLFRPRVRSGRQDHVQRFSVSYECPVIFGRDVFDPQNPMLAGVLRRREPGKRHRVAVFADDGVLAVHPELEKTIRRYAAAHAGAMEIVGDVVPVPGGEVAKNDPSIVQALLSALLKRSVDRHSYALAIGGGAVLDAVGFAASIFHRGVRLVRLPTTVLAQADSGVGVKNAVNHLGLKNLLGTFAPPFAIVNDGAFIDRLPAREKRGGMAEAVKVALIRDHDFFAWLESRAETLASFEPESLECLVRWCADLHMRQIAHGGDPFETGASRPLDFGHWSAHKLEILTGHALSHGEAVAIGIALDARYSVLAGLLACGQEDRIRAVLVALGFDLRSEAVRQRDSSGRLSILGGLRDFQEHLGGELTVTLLGGIGRSVDVHAIDEDLVERSVCWLTDELA